MDWVGLLAFLFKVAGQILDLHSQGELSSERKDQIIANLHQVQ